MGTTDEVRRLVAPLFAQRGLEVFDVEQSGPVLRVLVDRAGGVDLDALSEATRAVSSTLDAADPLPGRYTLEVSSPGVERPLRRPEHYQASVGATVAVKTSADHEGDRRLQGTLVAADEGGIVVRLGDGAERRLAFDHIERARTVFAWGPAPKPGRRRAPKTKATRS